MDIVHKINEIADYFFNGNNVSFAKRLGTSEANIRNYRSRIVPKVDFIVKMCNKLEISFDWLLNNEGPMLRDNKITTLEEGRVTYNGKSPEKTNNKLLGEELLTEIISSMEHTIKTHEDTIHFLISELNEKKHKKNT